MSTLNDFLERAKEKIPMLRMLSHMGIQDNQIQTDLRLEFLKNHTQDLEINENVRNDVFIHKISIIKYFHSSLALFHVYDDIVHKHVYM